MTPDQAYFTTAATPLGSLTPAEAPLIDAENLFRQPGPPQFASKKERQRCGLHPVPKTPSCGNSSGNTTYAPL